MAAQRRHRRGPLLDGLDYRLMADRIIHGTLSEVLAAAGHPVPNERLQAADTLPDADDEEEQA